MIIHLVKHSDSRDLLIHCFQKWTEPTWYSNVLPKLDSEIFWAEPINDVYIPYTFDVKKVTCKECREKSISIDN